MRFLRLFLVVYAFMIVPAFAQDKVSVRTGTHDTYSRLVFDWPSKPGYSLSKEGGRMIVRFAKAGVVDITAVDPSAQNIKSVQTLSAGSEPLQVAVAIPEGSKFRDFVVQNKLIIDVYNPDKTPPKVADEAPSETVTPPNSANATAAAPAGKPDAKTLEPDFTVQPSEPQQAVPLDHVEKAVIPAPQLQPHTITFTATSNIGLAAYERNGALYVITDAPEVTIDPLISGPQKDKLAPMTKFDIPAGKGYKMDLPDGMHASVSGGGLSWKILLDTKSSDGNSVQALNDMSGQEPKLIWPLKEMRKKLSFPDPVVGDKITVVTADDAAQFAGKGRNFVNLQTLDSAAGLALIPKTDDVVVDVSGDRVSVGRPGGLALSPSKDSQPDKIRQAMKTEPEKTQPEHKAEEPSVQETPPEKKPDAATAPESKPETTPVKPEHAEETAKEKPAEAVASHDPAHAVDAQSAEDLEKTKTALSNVAKIKPTGNNIYNFARWEMGGLPALENNQHVLLVQVAAKKPEDRVEDILTMAKLNLANNRGPETLGLLRIAIQEVPDLGDNPEFQGLRAAAYALSGKYDEAFADFTKDSLSKYDDVKYWLAYTLAGLEDWKQAGDVLPTDFAPIMTYPKPIRTPMLLTFAEIALRDAKVPQAQSILKLLQPDLATMSLPYKSSWTYLNGEAARQLGDYKKAEEQWTPLVKDGKDDLFRAKAGLSLTKLQIDEKKLKPEDAINRLEGLRYAWRGDELETLINYRLGQMYLDNKAYLKGLTVLRNAASLQPGTEMSKAVTDTMTRAFRDIFANDRLKNLSPVEAISLYEEFKDLSPPGAEADAYVEKLAERLVDADLLGRAASLLEYQVNNRLQGDKKAEVAIRLAAIRLLDDNPDGALRSLEVAQDALNKILPEAGTAPEAKTPDVTAPADKKVDPKKIAEKEPSKKESPATSAPKADPEKQRQIYLLKARALSMKKKTDDAMAILQAMRLDPDVNKLRTDIAWTAGRWDDAANSLNDLIIDEDISARSPLTPYQTGLLLNRAIALNLAGDRVALANLRDRYNAQMMSTDKGKMFEVVTRPRRPDMIGSREAIQSMISEIDLFKGFLDSYSKMDDGSKGGAKEPAPTPEPVPADKTVAPSPADATATEPPAKTDAAAPEAKAPEQAAPAAAAKP